MSVSLVLTALVAFFMGWAVGLVFQHWQGAKEIGRMDYEVKFLRGELVKKLEHERRVDRTEHGLSELQPEKPEEIVVPEAVQELCALFPAPASLQLLRETKKMYAAGLAWPAVEHQIREQIATQSPELLEALGV